MAAFSRSSKRSFVLVAVAALLLVAGATANALGQTRPATSSTSPTTLPFKISKDTTRITSPLKPDGTVDYLAAIEGPALQGVTPENNAGAALLRVLGPGMVGDPWMEQVQIAMGVELDPKATYPDMQPLIEARSLALQFAPWHATDHPEMASWLWQNANALDAIIAASKRPKCYLPNIVHDGRIIDGPGKGLLVTVAVPGVGSLHLVTWALTLRANLAIAEGRNQDAWPDLAAVYRLASLMEQRPVLIARLMGVSVGASADECTWNLATSGKLDAKSARAMLAELPRLGQPVTVLSSIDNSERYATLDVIQQAAVNPGKTISDILELAAAHKESGKPLPRTEAFWSARAREIDWDAVLVRVNEHYDEQIGTMKLPPRSRAQRESQRERSAMWKDGIASASSQPDESADAKTWTDWAGDFFIGNFVHTSSRLQQPVDVAVTKRQLTTIALTLAVHKAEKGKYPSALSELSPAYLKELPRDLFSDGKDFIYKSTGGGYMLYSVGENGKDDGGGVDDIVVRTPGAPAPPKSPRDSAN